MNRRNRRTSCSLNKRLGWGRKVMAKGSDLAVTRRLSGASQRSRMRPRSWRACCQMYRVELPLPLAPPFVALQSGAQTVPRHCCSDFAAAAVVARAGGVVAAVEAVVAAGGAFVVARRVVDSGLRRQVQVVSRLVSRAVVTGG